MRHVVARPVGALTALVVTAATAIAGLSVTQSGADAAAPRHYTVKTPTSVGYGGAVTSVDPEASRIGIRVLKHGGNAVDAAGATAAALGVTEPYSSGVGGGGYFVFRSGRTGKIHTIDGRETAPAAMPHDAFIDPKTGQPYNFSPQLVTSGVSVGVPGTPATWGTALRKWGRFSMRRALAPAAALARRGFVVDQTFHQQTEENKTRFQAYTTTPRLFLPHGDAPRVGSVLRNPALARTYRQLGRHGARWFYTGPIGHQVARLTRRPPKSPHTSLPVPRGYMHAGDLANYRAILRRPTHIGYRGYDVYGMAPSSSGGSTGGEALNIMERFDLAHMSLAAALHHYLEASALAFADRGKYVGDPAYVHVPLHALLSDRFARQRACLINETRALPQPVPAGDVNGQDQCDKASS